MCCAGAILLGLCALTSCESASGAPGPSAARTTSPTPASAARPSAATTHGGDDRHGAQEGRWAEAGGLRYLELIRGGAEAEDTLPLVVVLHGLGDRPRPVWFADFPARARFVLPQAPTAYGSGFSWFDYRPGEVDQAELGRAVLAAATQVAEAIAEIRLTRPTRGDVLVTGFSQGGMLSYALALYHPAHIAAAFPVAGALPEAAWPNAPKPGVTYPAIFAVHGTRDTIVPFTADRSMHAALRARGFEVELQPIPGARHEYTPAMGELVEQRLQAAIAESEARSD